MKIFACGDIVNSKPNKNIVDPKLKSIIKSCDHAICNLEAPLYDESQKAIPKCGASIYQCDDSINELRNIGFDIYSLANNHIYDYGYNGLKKTIKAIEEIECLHLGAGKDHKEAYRELVLDDGDVSVAFISAGENEFGCMGDKENIPGYAWILSNKIEDKVRDLKNRVDKVIIISHAGLEDVDVPLALWRDKYRRFIDIGADLVIGHHPHVPQGYETYKSRQIFYSLGNFFFDYDRKNKVTDDSYSLVLDINKQKMIDASIIYHKSVNFTTSLSNSENVSFNINDLNNLIQNSHDEKSTEICIKKYNSIYRNYYRKAMSLPSEKCSIFDLLKHLTKLMFFKEKLKFQSDLLFLHNIKIDTHVHVVKVALEDKFKNAK
ncbi:CapA family protein [Vibrio splendidus]